MNINKFVYKNRAIVGLCLNSALIWVLNLSGHFLMAHIFGQPQAERNLDPRFPLPRITLQPLGYYSKHGLWYQMSFERVTSAWDFEKQGRVFCEEVSYALTSNRERKISLKWGEKGRNPGRGKYLGQCLAFSIFSWAVSSSCMLSTLMSVVSPCSKAAWASILRLLTLINCIEIRDTYRLWMPQGGRQYAILFWLHLAINDFGTQLICALHFQENPSRDEAFAGSIS